MTRRRGFCPKYWVASVTDLNRANSTANICLKATFGLTAEDTPSQY